MRKNLSFCRKYKLTPKFINNGIPSLGFGAWDIFRIRRWKMRKKGARHGFLSKKFGDGYNNLAVCIDKRLI